MRYENSKSVILTILVLVSVVLTWNLWTYQPNYDLMKKGNIVAEVTVSEKQEVQKIIKPDEVLFHQKGGHYGTTNADEIDKISKELEKWTFYDVKIFNERFENFKQLTHGNGNTEIIFPGDIPIELYRSVLNFQEKKIPSFNFNRIIINVENTEKENGIVYFVNTDLQQIFISHISLANLAEFNRNFYKNAAQFPHYFAYNASDKKTIFLPEGETEMMTYKYIPRYLNADEFKEALFTDPSFVQKSYISKNEEEFSNAYSKMTVNNDKGTLVYVNPTTEMKYTESSYDLVKRSIDFVNEHGGWTDPFRFFSKNEVDHSVTFRLYSVEGYPVFNPKGVSEIKEVWGRDEINKYIRPNIALDFPLTSGTQKVTLPSGREALKFIQNIKNFKPELLDQLILGYQMKKDTEEEQLILLEPAWFYHYDKEWKQIPMDGAGGINRGLE